MQVQQTRNITQSMSHTQSIAAVQTLLRAGLGAITFLRNLLPEDNFAPSHFTSIDDGASSSAGSFQLDSSQESNMSRRNVNSFRIMTLTRGYTDEADRLLNYLEYGIFDALEKQYLRSFIFAIYLDNKDPTNIVEAYTFNFKYYTIPGTSTTIPIMSLGDGLKRMSLRNQKDVEDPVAKAIKNGKAPTLKDVKSSAMLKTLIHIMHHMDPLPRRRFATFKVYYTEKTPVNYEPPHFQAGDVDKDKWFFMTHDLDEMPDRCSVGKVETGHHSVSVSVTSIASYLPSSTEHDSAAFSGTVPHPGNHVLTPMQEASICKQQAERQQEDAERRNIAWAVEDSVKLGDDVDAEGDDDPDYLRQPDGSYQRADVVVPVGIRNKDGSIETLPADVQDEEVRYDGFVERVPTRLQEFAAEQEPVSNGLEETQCLSSTPRRTEPRAPSSASSVDQLIPSPLSDIRTTPSTRATSFDPEMLKSMTLEASESCDTEMLDLETQVTSREPMASDSIESFPASNAMDAVRNDGLLVAGERLSDNGLQCECGIPEEDGTFVFCEGGCKKWFHLWCMGYRDLLSLNCLASALIFYLPRYHSGNDKRIPSAFKCFDCRARSDVTWELIKFDIYPQMLSKFKDLALFRRAIKVAQYERSFSAMEFAKSFGCDVVLGGQLLKRLEDEDFISKESTTLDDMGLTVTTRGKTTKGKGKVKQPRKNMQKSRFVFNHSLETKAQYLDYFKPDDQDIEKHLLGVADLAKPRQKPAKNIMPETQTQEETNTRDTRNKRTVSQTADETQDAERPSKKVKISVAAAVDLAE
ncbi:unnamed protein product [Cyclocybe aegerita]|uniref:HORMA domain-containing protein n=1 Tax=Cyclocybe aegerita TaxID=1973307 RepID=A0A8S0X9M6_CYCAE|nr:unnamed protein product [Cyclocybe aegerita]